MIPLTKGSVAIVDDEDFAALSRFKWFCDNDGYAKRNAVAPSGKKVGLIMHRVILRAQPGILVDHINQDKRDNRRANLRTCSHTENVRNVPARIGTSHFKGVNWYTKYGKWVSRIQVDKKRILLGYFSDEINAALAYDTAALKHFREFAVLNFPQVEQKCT